MATEDSLPEYNDKNCSFLPGGKNYIPLNDSARNSII